MQKKISGEFVCLCTMKAKARKIYRYSSVIISVRMVCESLSCLIFQEVRHRCFLLGAQTCFCLVGKEPKASVQKFNFMCIFCPLNHLLTAQQEASIT